MTYDLEELFSDAWQTYWEMEEILGKEGKIITSLSNTPRVHPATSVQKQAADQMVKIWKLLEKTEETGKSKKIDSFLEHGKYEIRSSQS